MYKVSVIFNFSDDNNKNNISNNKNFIITSVLQEVILKICSLGGNGSKLHEDEIARSRNCTKILLNEDKFTRGSICTRVKN